ncbi:MAG: hypothetical protein CMJ24_02350 [Phycisphaerae bacterium]|nr:hypothetical protein [Phycisphaerae bacterium]|tara:strand:+ start:19434 stop:20090 length:657 start_codon:yes stop_codon:yes gene_type:complete
MNKMLLSVGAVCFLWAGGPANGSWVDFVDPLRQSTLDVGGFGYDIETSGEGAWYSDMSVGDSTGFASAGQQSDFGSSWIDFSASTFAESDLLNAMTGAETSLMVQLVIEEPAMLSIDWSFQMDRSSEASTRGGFRIDDDQSGGAIYEIDARTTGSGISMITLNEGIYLVSILVSSEAESGENFASVDAGILVEFVVPAPGGLMAFLLAMIPFRGRSRR